MAGSHSHKNSTSLPVQNGAAHHNLLLNVSVIARPMAAPSAHVQGAQMSCCEAPVVLSPGRWPRPKPKFKAREARDDSFGLLILFLSVTLHAVNQYDDFAPSSNSRRANVVLRGVLLYAAAAATCSATQKLSLRRSRHSRGFMCGNSITSRIDGALVSSMASRSMPMPSPAVGGMPYSRASM